MIQCDPPTVNVNHLPACSLMSELKKVTRCGSRFDLQNEANIKIGKDKCMTSNRENDMKYAQPWSPTNKRTRLASLE